MPIYQQGSLNTTALIVPDLYVQIVPPNNILLNGVPTNVLGLVGTASWGPVNQPFTIGSTAEYQQFFGPVVNRAYDCGTAVAVATLQGAQNFLVNRVTDGTDAAANFALTASDSTMTITIGGTAHLGDVLTLNITPNYPTQAASAVWTTSSRTITMGSTAPTGFAPGQGVYDNTSGKMIGYALSYVSTTLTLLSAATFASTGSTDSLSFGGFNTAIPAITYQMTSTDTITTGAAGLSAAVANNATAYAAGISSDTNAAGVFKLHWSGTAPTVTATVTGVGATTTCVAGSASSTTGVTQITFWSIYTGSYGNNQQVTITNGSSYGSWKVIITVPGLVPETFDNIAQGLSGNQVWSVIASAINNGVSGIRGPSQFVRANAGVGVGYQQGYYNNGAGGVTYGSSAPSAATANWPTVVNTPAPTRYMASLTGGTDGYTGFIGTNPLTGYSNANTWLLGSDTMTTNPQTGIPSRTGMYALRNQGVSICVLCDCPDMSTLSAQTSFGLFEGIYMIFAGPSGDTILNATGPTGTLSTYGINSYAVKAMFGDWIYWLDTVNNLQRLVSPASIVAGLLSNLSPEQSSINKKVYGIIGTQKSLTGINYTQADLQALAGSGWDVICNPIPQGSVFGDRLGHNTSSNAVIHGDNYTRMTNYIAATLDRGMGQFIGKTQSIRPTDQTRYDVKATLDAFMQALLNARMIDDYQNQCDLNNNTQNSIALGYLIANCKVRYLAIVEYFIVNLQGGQSVTITKINPAATNVGGTFAAIPTTNSLTGF